MVWHTGQCLGDHLKWRKVQKHSRLAAHLVGLRHSWGLGCCRDLHPRSVEAASRGLCLRTRSHDITDQTVTCTACVTDSVHGLHGSLLGCAMSRPPRMRGHPQVGANLPSLRSCSPRARQNPVATDKSGPICGGIQEGLTRRIVPGSLERLHGLYDEGKAEGTRRMQTSVVCRSRLVHLPFSNLQCRWLQHGRDVSSTVSAASSEAVL